MAASVWATYFGGAVRWTRESPCPFKKAGVITGAAEDGTLPDGRQLVEGIWLAQRPPSYLPAATFQGQAALLIARWGSAWRAAWAPLPR